MDADGASGPALGAALLAAPARVPTCVSRCQSRSESPALSPSHKSPGPQRVRQRSAPAPTEGAGFRNPRRARLQRGSRLTPSRGGKRFGCLPTTVGFAATWERRRSNCPPARRPLRARARDRKSKIATGPGEHTAKGRWMDRSDQRGLSRGHVEVEFLPATPLFAVRRRRHAGQGVHVGGSEA